MPLRGYTVPVCVVASRIAGSGCIWKVVGVLWPQQQLEAQLVLRSMTSLHTGGAQQALMQRHHKCPAGS
jgi:hypothetical protein